MSLRLNSDLKLLVKNCRAIAPEEILRIEEDFQGLLSSIMIKGLPRSCNIMDLLFKRNR